ncbi:MAG TPA: hypothetical protein VFV66_17235 [Nonomuraea sp.]|nr:hypothetical protein [Nonomuraea sp.]
MPGTRVRDRRRPRPVYTDVTLAGGPPAPHPEEVLAFQEVGYEVVGLVHLDVEPGGVAELAADYSPEDGAALLEHGTLPATMLRSADGLVQASVSWFWAEPAVQLRTWMDDDSLVETHRRWPEVPPWPRRRAAAWRHATVEGEMTRQAADGRSIATVPSAEAARLDEAHRAHVQAYAETYGCTPVAAPATMAETLSSLERATLHMWRVGEAYARTGNVVLVVIALAVAASSWVLHAASVPWAVVWSLGGAVAVVASLNRFAARFAYTRWWRPAYR